MMSQDKSNRSSVGKFDPFLLMKLEVCQKRKITIACVRHDLQKMFKLEERFYKLFSMKL